MAVTAGAAALRFELLLIGAPVAERGERVAVVAGLVGVRVASCAASTLAEQLEHLHVVVVERMGLRRVDLERSTRLRILETAARRPSTSAARRRDGAGRCAVDHLVSLPELEHDGVGAGSARARSTRAP